MTRDDIRSTLRWLPALVGALLGALGLVCLFAPSVAATRFDLFPSGPAGYGNLRGDLGAFFLVGAGCAVFGALRAERRWLGVPIAMLTLVLLARLISFAVDGSSAAGLRSFTIEIVLLLALLAGGYALGGAIAPRGRGARALVTAGAALAVLLTAALIWQRPLGMWLAAATIANRTGTSPIDDLPDGLHVGLCGSGSPMPDAQRAGPCVVVIAGKHVFIVDAGEGSPRKLALMGVAPARVEAVLLTHFHSDHIGGLGELMLQRWAGSGSATPLEVFGPQGVEAVVEGFNRAYELDKGYRVAHHGAATVPPTGAGGVARPFEIPQGRDVQQVVLERDGLKITAFNVIHTPVFPAVGYRFDYAGRAVVVSGDTAPSRWLAHIASGADVLLHEALNQEMVAMLHQRAVALGMRNAAKITADIPSYHTDPEQAARLAEEAHVAHLVLYHIIPPLPSPLMRAAFLGDAPARYHGPITIARDGLLLSLPRDSRAIALRDLL